MYLRLNYSPEIHINKIYGNGKKKGAAVNTNNQSQQIIKASNLREYFEKQFIDESVSFVNGGSIQTGFPSIDSKTKLYPGFYVLGAISSLGKTTFVHQMCDQLASMGERVLFFSFEQTTLELATKSLSRIMARRNTSLAMTALQIRMNSTDARVKNAIAEYNRYSNNITIVECNFKVNIDEIEQYVCKYISEHNVRPIVVIDYLQVIPCQNNNRMQTKDIVDMHVRRLKQLQSDNSLILITISSLNRQNYYSQIDFESFKESGGIEYTADVILGLQLQVLSEPLFDKQGNINEKREKIRNAKAALPRKITLLCLKNRFGISSYTCSFDYYPQFDLFNDSSAQSIESSFFNFPENSTEPLPYT